VTNSLRHITYS